MIILLLSSRCLQSKKELIQLCWRIKINWQCHEFRLNNNPLSNTERKKWCIGQKEIYRIIFIFDFITCTVDVKANLHTWKKKIVNDVRFCTKRSLQNYFDIWLQDMYIVDVKANLHTWKKIENVAWFPEILIWWNHPVLYFLLSLELFFLLL